MEGGINILIIEDNKGSILLLQEVLRQTGKEINITVEKSANNTLNYLKKTNQLPDLIFLDLNMPKEDGWHVLDEYPKDANLHQIPIFILSTSILMRDRLKAREYPNIAGFYTKPITLKKINEILGYYARLKK